MTPQQILDAQKMLKQYNYTPPATSGQPLNADQQVDAYLAKNKAPAPAAAPTNPVAETGQNYMENVAPAASDVNDIMKGFSGGAVDTGAPKGNIGTAVDKFSKGDVLGGAEDATLGVAKDAAQAIFAPIAAPIQTLLSHLMANATPNTTPGLPDVHSPEAQAARQQIADWAQAHPQIAKTLGDAFVVGTSALGSGALDTSLSDAATGVKNAVTKPLSAAKDAVMGTPEVKAVAQTAKDTTSTISALDPELKGAKLNNAYKEVVTKDRTVTPSGFFTEQKLSPSERTIALGKRLVGNVPLSEGDSLPGIVLSKDPVKNLSTLKTALTDTESRLTSALKGDPEINFNADKQTLFDNLNAARDAAPEEFRIGENKVMTKNVYNFANKIAKDADDSIEGLRDARTAFDNQVKVQYPNAFNPDGTVNVRTAAGSAVKNARDIFNEHLYNTAPAGSDIQKLIGREADIFQATNPVAARAASGAGKTVPQKVMGKIKDHPIITTAGAAATGVAAAKGLGI